jgi:hydrogenase maturation factor HypF (carbamoyltransferase family)
MKHLKKYEDFAYHSKNENKNSRSEIRLDIHKCHKCRKKIKPEYNFSLKPLERLF